MSDRRLRGRPNLRDEARLLCGVGSDELANDAILALILSVLIYKSAGPGVSTSDSPSLSDTAVPGRGSAEGEGAVTEGIFAEEGASARSGCIFGTREPHSLIGLLKSFLPRNPSKPICVVLRALFGDIAGDLDM